jgi:hypothetical protein
MATTRAYSGKLTTSARFSALLSGDRTGSEVAEQSNNITFDPAGGDAPTISGFLSGEATCAAGDWLLAHATDPLQGMGASVYSGDFTVAGTKLKYLEIRNEDATNSITISRKTTNGLPIFNAADDAITLAPGDILIIHKKAGTAALSTGSNDALTVAVSGGSPVAQIIAAYGP